MTDTQASPDLPIAPCCLPGGVCYEAGLADIQHKDEASPDLDDLVWRLTQTGCYHDDCHQERLEAAATIERLREALRSAQVALRSSMPVFPDVQREVDAALNERTDNG